MSSRTKPIAVSDREAPNFVSNQGATCALNVVADGRWGWSYTEAGPVVVCAGMPTDERGPKTALERLLGWAGRRGQTPLLFGVELADLCWLSDWKIRELGRQPIFVAGSRHDPALTGKGQPELGREMRRQARRALSKGVGWTEVSAAEFWECRERGDLESLFKTRWMRQPLAEFSFLVGLHLAAGQTYRRFFLLGHEGGGKPLGLALLVRSDRGWLLEHQIVGADAPNGSGELLVAQILSRALEPGQCLSLGITPLYRALAADLPHREIPAILSFMPEPVKNALLAAWEPLYGFRRLERFRAKLEPDRWEPVYWAQYRGSSSAALWAVLKVFAGGSMLGFGWATVLKLLGKVSNFLSSRGLVAINDFFLISLCFWIPILWHLDGEWLFGTAVATRMWALYDVGLVAGFGLHGRLLRLKSQAARTHSAVMLGLVGADAGLSMLWSFLHNAVLFLLAAAPLAASLYFLVCLAYPTNFLRHGGSRGELENL